LRIPPALRSRPLPKLLIAAALAWVGWQIVTNTAADTLAASDPERALAWSPRHAGALVAVADQQIDAAEIEEGSGEGIAEPDQIAALGRGALVADPLNADVLRVLATAADSADEPERATRLMQLAARRSSRDARVQGWLLNQRLIDGDVPGALLSIDATLRAWPDLREAVAPVLAALATDTEAVTPVVAILARDPPWRAWFMRTLPGETEDVEALQALYAGLKATPSPPTVDELRAYLGRLLALGEFERAHSETVAFLPPGRVAEDGGISNGDFDEPVDNLPFGWSIGKVRGATAEIVTDGNDNKALRVQFHNTRVRYQHVSQLLMLEPGVYRLTGRVRTIALQNERGLEWAVHCAGNGKVIGATPRASGTIAWSDFETVFVIPAEAECAAQLLRLVLPARVASEQQISGEVWYDDVSVVSAPEALPTQ
jgi:hypothetical protein